MSRKHTLRLFAAFLLCLGIAFATGIVTQQLWGEFMAKRSQPLGVFWEAWTQVEKYFYGDIPSPQERTYGAIREVLALLDDPYTTFVAPQPHELERDRMRGSFGGIGVTLWRNVEGQMILFPYSDSPAERAGVIEEDILLALGGTEITPATTLDDAMSHIHGEIGTAVTLTISRPPTPPFDLTITREEIQVPSVIWRVLDQATGIGYIHIKSFTERTSDETVIAIQELQAAGATNLVLDLRDDSGGLLDPAVVVASQFLNDGVVLYEINRASEERTLQVQPGGVATDIPLVVLVNGETASAAEVVAGALQDHSRALLIGEPTFGKGSVQLIYEISDGSSLHVTSAVWLTPNRNKINGKGLTPDIYIARGDDLSDEQLDRAVAYLQSQ